MEVSIDGVQVFSVTDSSFSSGRLGLYARGNSGSRFDDILVEDLVTGATLLSEGFNDGDYNGWSIVDDGIWGGPSVWSASSGTLVQDSNIFSMVNGFGLGTYALY